MNSLVERLRNPFKVTGEDAAEAAARIERLEAALRPFACKCSVKGMGAGGNCTRGSGECDCWNARVALEATPASLMAAPVWDAAEPARAALGERT